MKDWMIALIVIFIILGFAFSLAYGLVILEKNIFNEERIIECCQKKK